jgi:large conductance mechanosensitive channel
MLKDFKTFLLRGNVVDLAVAVVIGTAFGAVVTALVKDLITPLIAAIGGNPDFGGLKFTVNSSQFLYGEFLNQLISFVLIAAVIFFFVVQPTNHLIKLANRRAAKGQTEEEVKDPQLIVLEEIRDSLRKNGKR